MLVFCLPVGTTNQRLDIKICWPSKRVVGLPELVHLQ